MNTLCAFAALGIPLQVSTLAMPVHPGITGSGIAKSERRTIGEFSAIVSAIPAKVSIDISSGRGLAIKADDNLLRFITTRVERGALVIGADERISIKTPIVVTIRAKRLKSALLAGAGSISIRGIHEPSFVARIDGTGDISATGTAQKVEASLNGAGSIRLFGLTSQTADAGLNGTGKIELNARDLLRSSIAGAGTIRYKGKPKVVSSRTGVGSIGPA